MKKSDLRTGMRVTQSNGQQYLVYLNTQFGDMFIGSHEHNRIDYYNEDLTHDYSDIIKVEAPKKAFQLRTEEQKFETIWEREDVKEYTMQEAIEKMGHEFKIIK
jgi:hypothetical protein